MEVMFNSSMLTAACHLSDKLLFCWILINVINVLQSEPNMIIFHAVVEWFRFYSCWIKLVGYRWLSLAIAGYRWLSLAIAGYRWLSLAIVGYRWLSSEFLKTLPIRVAFLTIVDGARLSEFGRDDRTSADRQRAQTDIAPGSWLSTCCLIVFDSELPYRVRGSMFGCDVDFTWPYTSHVSYTIIIVGVCCSSLTH